MGFYLFNFLKHFVVFFFILLLLLKGRGMGAWVFFFHFLLFLLLLKGEVGCEVFFIKLSLFISFKLSFISFLLLFLVLKVGERVVGVFLGFHFSFFSCL